MSPFFNIVGVEITEPSVGYFHLSEPVFERQNKSFPDPKTMSSFCIKVGLEYIGFDAVNSHFKLPSSEMQ
jgi:hypothetical protein